MLVRQCPPAALLVAATSLLLGACVLDLGGLTGGVTGGAGGSASGGKGPGGAGGTAPGCDLLDCAPCAGACPEGGCPPTPVPTPSDVDRPWAVAVSEDAVYWVNQHGYTVARRKKGSPASEVITTATAPTAIAAAFGTVIWADLDGLWSCPADTCNAAKKKLYASLSPGSLGGVAYDGQTVYFTDRGTGQADGKVLRCAPDACGSPQEIVTGQLAPAGIALTSDSVLWSDMGTGEQNGNVYKASKAGQNVTLIASSLILPTAVVADEIHVWFTQWSADGKVFRCTHTQGYCDAPFDIAPAAGFLALPFDLALAGDRVYWSSTGDGVVASCPIDGCVESAPRVHVKERTGLREIALGKACLFWVDDTGGGVYQVPR
jgi:hypothetical protein